MPASMLVWGGKKGSGKEGAVLNWMLQVCWGQNQVLLLLSPCLSLAGSCFPALVVASVTSLVECCSVFMSRCGAGVRCWEVGSTASRRSWPSAWCGTCEAEGAALAVWEALCSGGGGAGPGAGRSGWQAADRAVTGCPGA